MKNFAQEKYFYFFKNERKEQFSCANKIQQIILNNKHVIVKAPEKSGKREVMEISALLNNNAYNIFVTSLNKKDMKIQHEELKEFGIIPFIITKKKDKEDLIKLLNNKPANKTPIIVHWDESDFGTDIKQQAKTILEDLIKRDNCFIVFYSATNEEIEYSKFGSRSCDIIDFTPHKSYFGFADYLNSNLVEEAQSFLNADETISEHGKFVINYWLTTNKP